MRDCLKLGSLESISESQLEVLNRKDIDEVKINSLQLFNDMSA